MKNEVCTVCLFLAVVVIFSSVNCQVPNAWKPPTNRARSRAKSFDFSQLFTNRNLGTVRESTFPSNRNFQEPMRSKNVDPFSRFITNSHLAASDNYNPAPIPYNQPANPVPAHFFPPHIVESPDYGPNDAFNYQHSQWAVQPFNQRNQHVGARGSPPSRAPVPSQQTPGRYPNAASNQFQGTQLTGPGGIAMCRPTPSMPRLCDVNGESNLNYRLIDVMKAIPSMKKVPQCYRNIPRVQCNSYHAAQYIWREGFCYCKYYKNNAHLYRGQQLECVLNDCGACTQEFYVGNQRLVCD